VIPNPEEIARLLGLNPTFAALFLAGVVTAIVFLVQSLAGWLQDTDS